MPLFVASSPFRALIRYYRIRLSGVVRIPFGGYFCVKKDMAMYDKYGNSPEVTEHVPGYAPSPEGGSGGSGVMTVVGGRYFTVYADSADASSIRRMVMCDALGEDMLLTGKFQVIIAQSPSGTCGDPNSWTGPCGVFNGVEEIAVHVGMDAPDGFTNIFANMSQYTLRATVIPLKTPE